MTPFVVHSLGERTYGFWSLAGTLAGYYGLLDLGIHTAVMRFVSQELAREDTKGANEVVNAALTILFVTAGIALCFSIAGFYGASTWFGVGSADSAFRWVVLIVGLQLSVSLPVRAFGGVLSARIRYDLSSMASIIRLLVGNLAIYTALSTGRGVITMALVNAEAAGLEYLFLILFAKRVFPQLHLSPFSISRKRLGIMFSYSSKSFVNSILEMSRHQLQNFFVAALSSLNNVTYYALARRLVSYYMRSLFAVFGNMTAVFSHYDGCGDRDRLERAFYSSLRVYIAGAYFGGASMIFYGRCFIARWMGGSFDQTYWVLVILISAFTLVVSQDPVKHLIYALAQHHYVTLVTGVGCIILLTLLFLLGPRYGVIGIAVATAIEQATSAVILMPLALNKAWKLDMRRYMVVSFGWEPVKTLLPLCAFFCLTHGLLRPSYFILVGLVTVQTVLFVPWFFWVVLGREERTHISGLVRSILKGRQWCKPARYRE